jgi:hypothetical protein
MNLVIGNEDDYIIVSLVRTQKIGFLSDQRRMNVMLTRCKKGMIIVANRAFVEGIASESLAGQLATAMGPDAWLASDRGALTRLNISRIFS